MSETTEPREEEPHCKPSTEPVERGDDDDAWSQQGDSESDFTEDEGENPPRREPEPVHVTLAAQQWLEARCIILFQNFGVAFFNIEDRYANFKVTFRDGDLMDQWDHEDRRRMKGLSTSQVDSWRHLFMTGRLRSVEGDHNLWKLGMFDDVMTGAYAADDYGAGVFVTEKHELTEAAWTIIEAVYKDKKYYRFWSGKQVQKTEKILINLVKRVVQLFGPAQFLNEYVDQLPADPWGTIISLKPSARAQQLEYWLQRGGREKLVDTLTSERGSNLPHGDPQISNLEIATDLYDRKARKGLIQMLLWQRGGLLPPRTHGRPLLPDLRALEKDLALTTHWDQMIFGLYDEAYAYAKELVAEQNGRRKPVGKKYFFYP